MINKDSIHTIVNNVESFMKTRNVYMFILSLINSTLLLVLVLTKNTKFSEIICFTCNNLPPLLGKVSISYAGFATSVTLLALSCFTRKRMFVFGITIFISMIGVCMSSYLVSYQILANKNMCKFCFISSCLFLLILISSLYEIYNWKNIIGEESI